MEPVKVSVKYTKPRCVEQAYVSRLALLTGGAN